MRPCLLRRGATGPLVACLTELLGAAPTDLFDAEVEQAVKSFQQRRGLVQDGVVGGRTWYALFKVQGGFTPPIRPDDHLGPQRQMGTGPYVVTSPFGDRISPYTGRPSFHNGIDLRAEQGTPLYPVAAGVVVKLYDDDVNGYAVQIDHGAYSSSYVHMSRMDVEVGEEVDEATRIGLSGGALGLPGSGRSRASHLHLTLRFRRLYVDGVPLIDWGEEGVLLKRAPLDYRNPAPVVSL